MQITRAADARGALLNWLHAHFFVLHDIILDGKILYFIDTAHRDWANVQHD